MTKFTSGLAALVMLGFLTGCSGSTPGSMTPTKPRSASEDPTMDPFERVGTQLKEKQTSSSPPVTVPQPVAAPAPAPASAPQPVAAPVPAAPATKAAQ